MVLAGLAGIVLNYLTNLVSASFPRPLVRWRWPVFGLAVAVFLAVAIWQAWPTRSAGRSAERKRRDRMMMVARVEVATRGILAAGMADVEELPLGLLARPDLVRQPGAADRRDAGKTVSAGSVADIFAREGRSLLVTGGGGSGKSMLLARLCHDLCLESAASPEPVIPVLLNLASWGEKDTSLENWMRRAIPGRYQPGVLESNVSEWLADGTLLPVLDGLNEVPSRLRRTVIRAINQYLRDGLRPVAVACRTSDYLTARCPLEASFAVEVAPLARQEVMQALDRIGGPVAESAASVPQRDRDWWDMIGTPLMLGIISRITVLAPGTPIKTTGADRRDNLIGTYITVLSQRMPSPRERFSPQDAIRWLAWLASRMSARGTREFSYDKIDPAWFADVTDPARLKTFPYTAGYLLVCISTTLCTTVLGVRPGTPVLQLTSFISVCGLMSVMTALNVRRRQVTRDGPIRPVWTMHLVRWDEVLGTVTTFGVISVAVFALRPPRLRWMHMTAPRLLAFMTAMIVIATLLTMVNQVEPRSIPDGSRIAPGRQLARSRANARRAMLAVIPLTAAVSAGEALVWHDAMAAGAVFAGLTGCSAACMWMISGGVAPAQHRRIIRAIARQGHGPAAYLDFLTWSADRLLLHAADGVFLFPHPEIQDYLARIPQAPRPSSPGTRDHRRA